MKIKKCIGLILEIFFVLCFLIIISNFMARVIYGSIDSFSLIFEDTKYVFKMFYINAYKFHFSNISVFFILLICQYIRKIYSEQVNGNILIIFFLNILYMFIANCIYYVLEFNFQFFEDKLTSYDLTITILIFLFAQMSTLYFYHELNINKKYIRNIYLFEHPIYFAVLIHLYYSQYTYFTATYSKIELYIICLALVFFMIICFIYNVYLIHQMNIYLENIRFISKDSLIYVFITEKNENSMFFKYFIKPCIKELYYVIWSIRKNINGVVLLEEQYEYCKDYIKDNISICIDCYSKYFSNSNKIIYLEQFSYSVAITERQIFNENDIDVISILKEKYPQILITKSFKGLKNSIQAEEFLRLVEKESKYVHEIKRAREELIDSKLILNIRPFDKYFVFILNKAEREIDRYTAFNNILKGFEAIIHYVCVYYLTNLQIKINDEWGDFKIIDQVEKGGLGTWLEMVYRVLKIKNIYKESLLSNGIGNSISELFAQINYPTSTKFKSNNVRSNESYYHFFSNRIVNLRNCTIGHGSSTYIPSDKELVNLYKIFLHILQKIYSQFRPILIKQDTIWMVSIDENIALLDKLTSELNELRYLDYFSEKSIPQIFKKTGEKNV